MSASIKLPEISRRMVFIFDLAAAASLAVPTAMLTTTDAAAQTRGMEGRDDRGTGDATIGEQKKEEGKAVGGIVACHQGGFSSLAGSLVPQCHRWQTFPAPHIAHLRTCLRTWRLVVLATQTPSTRVRPTPHPRATCVVMASV